MTTLSEDKVRAKEIGNINALPAVADNIVFYGAAVGLSSGNARPLVSGDDFAGFCEEQCDNTGGDAGDKNVVVEEVGKRELVVAGANSITFAGYTVYADDDDTFGITNSGATPIGKIVRVTNTTLEEAIVAFEAKSRRSI